MSTRSNGTPKAARFPGRMATGSVMNLTSTWSIPKCLHPVPLPSGSEHAEHDVTDMLNTEHETITQAAHTGTTGVRHVIVKWKLFPLKQQRVRGSSYRIKVHNVHFHVFGDVHVHHIYTQEHHRNQIVVQQEAKLSWKTVTILRGRISFATHSS